jgi:ABC-type nitrate/sulfonate/bicarbonate transport system permease component
MNHRQIAEQLDKRIKRSALCLVAVSLALGFLLGLAVGYAIGWHTIERVTVVPLSQGIRT